MLVALLLGAFLLVLPHLRLGYPAGHSAHLTPFWYEHFRDQLFDGEGLPAWLFGYWNGLGAPVFYFYAPLPFYLLALVDFVTLRQWDDLSVLTGGHLLLFWLSGVAFYVVARRFTTPLWSIAVAAAYTALPYHYIDIEVRGALGEGAAYISLPLVLNSVLRVEKTPWTTMFGAVAYAGLVVSHLPSALLAAPFVALCALLSSPSEARARSLAHAVILGLVGVALGAFYLIPAVALRDTLAHDAWITAQGLHYLPTRWLVGTADLPSFGRFVYEVLAGTTAVGVGSWAVSRAMRRARSATESAPAPPYLGRALIASLCLCWFMMSAPSRWLWEAIPVLRQVQFPWRLGVVVDVSSLLLVAAYAPPVLERGLEALGLSYRRQRTAAVVVCVVAVGVLVAVVPHAYFPSTPAVKADLVQEAAPIEYRPRWLVESRTYLGGRDAEDLRDIDVALDLHAEGVRRFRRVVDRIRPIQAARRLDPKESITIESDGLRRAVVVSALESSTRVRIKRVYYPHWRLRSEKGEEVPIVPDRSTGLVACELPEGQHTLRLDRRLLPAEIIGRLVSVIAGLILLSLAVVARRLR